MRMQRIETVCLLVLTLATSIALCDVSQPESDKKYALVSSVCVLTSAKVLELPSDIGVALKHCHEMHNCYHVLSKALANGSQNLGILQSLPKLSISKMPEAKCRLYTKNNALNDIVNNGFTPERICPAESGENLEKMQPQKLQSTFKSCAYACITTPTCEFFSYNNTCYFGSLNSYMISRAYADNRCKIFKKRKPYDLNWVAFYAFSHSLANVADRTILNMEKVGGPVMTHEGVHLSHGNYLRTKEDVLQLRDHYLAEGKSLQVVLKLKRSVPKDLSEKPGPSDLTQWLTVSAANDLDNYGLLLVENVRDKQLILQVRAVGTGNMYTSHVQLKTVPSPNQESWICVSVCFSNDGVFWIVNGVRYSGSRQVSHDASTTADTKWEMMSLADSGDMNTRLPLNGVVQSMAIVHSVELSANIVNDMCGV